MRQWAGPIGFIGATASLVFWLVVLFFGGGNAVVLADAGNGVIAIAFAVLSALGVAGALIAGASSRLAPALLAAAVVPAIGALLLPGLLVVVAALLALDEPAPQTGGGLAR